MARGLALVEQLVALALGLLVVVAGASAYLGASETSRMADAQARLHDDGQAALALLAQQVRMAGSRDIQAALADAADAADTTPALRGCDSSFDNIRSAAGLDDLVCSGADPQAPHAFAVRYEADRFNTIPTATGEPTDCVGNALGPRTRAAKDNDANPADAGPIYLADNRYFIAPAGGSGVPSLYCKGAGGAAQPLMENVEDLRLLYGVAASANQAAVAGYLTASELHTRATANAVPTPWAQVRAVQICIVVRSEQPVSDAGWAPYRRCDGALESHAPDRRLRRAFSTTVTLRNAPGAGLLSP